MASLQLTPSPSAIDAQVSAASPPRLLPSPSDASAQLRTPPPANGPASDSVIVDFEVLVRKLAQKEASELKKFLLEFDDKELKAVREKLDEAKDRRSRKTSKENEAENEAEDKAYLPQCYVEIKSLLKIEKNPVLAKALQEWTRKEVLFTNRVERKKSKSADLKNEIYQLIGFFSVFQGVLLTAVSQSNLLHCNNWWSPIILSVVASIVTIFGVVQKLTQIRKFQRTIHSEELSLKEVVARINNLRNGNVDNFRFAKFLEKDFSEQSTLRFKLYQWLVIGSLIVFTVGFPISEWRILCHSGYNPYAAIVPTSSPKPRLTHNSKRGLDIMGHKVTVKNKTGTTIKIREGNAGVYVNLKTLIDKAEYTLKQDPHATYREYVLITLPDNTPLQQMFSSDDVTEYREITVKRNAREQSPMYYWEGTLRGKKTEPAQLNIGGKGVAVDGKGVAVDGKGVAVDGKGVAVDGKGVAVDGKGVAVDGKGIAVDGKGVAVDGKGVAMDGKGLAVDNKTLDQPRKGWFRRLTGL